MKSRTLGSFVIAINALFGGVHLANAYTIYMTNETFTREVITAIGSGTAGIMITIAIIFLLEKDT